MSDQRHQLSKTFISNVELEAIKKKNADLQFCLDKEVARVMELTQQSSKLQSRVDFLNEQNSAQQEQNAELVVELKKAISLRVTLYRHSDMEGDTDKLTDDEIVQRDVFARQWTQAIAKAGEAK